MIMNFTPSPTSARIHRGQEDRKGKFLDRIAGVVFLGTPHVGSIIATIASQLQWFVSDSTRDLKANDAALLDACATEATFGG
jgi:hypothetical protein